MTRTSLFQRQGFRAILLGLLIATSGCNVFEGMYALGESDDPKVLLQDAAYALRKNEPGKAVTILERALQKDPQNAEVRVSLANALLAANDVSVLDLIALYENISKDAGGTAAQGALSKSANHCTFNDAAIGTPQVRAFDPSFENIQQLVGNQALFERITALITPILPAALLATPYNVPDLTQPQALAVVAAIKAQSGLSDEQVANLLLINATATIIKVYNEMFYNTPGVTWYLIRAVTGNEYIGACATNIAAVKVKAACQLPKLQGAANSLRVRGYLVGGEAATLADEFNTALGRLEAELGTGATCPAT